jgi:hypothetical protein
MADDKKIKELESLIAKLEKLTKTKYDLNIDTSNIKQVNSQINVLNRAIKDAEKEVASLDNTFNGLNKEIKGIVAEMGNWGTATSKATKAFKNIENITQQLKYDEKGLSELSKKDLERLQKQLKINKDELIEAAKLVKKKQENLGIGQELTEEEKAILIGYEEEFSIIDRINEKTKERLVEEKKIEKQIGLAGKALDGLKKIPILGEILNIDEAKEDMRDLAKQGKGSFEILGKGLSSAFSGLGPLAIIAGIAKAVQMLAGAMFEADKRVTDISKNLSISKDNARGIYNNIKNTKTDLDTAYKTTTNLSEAFNDISQLTGFAAIATNDQLEAQIVLTKQLGQSKEEALGLQETFAVNNIEADKGIDIVYDQIAAFANQNKIVADGRKILTEVSKTSKLIQLNFKGNTPELVKTVLEAKKLGLTLDQVNKTASSLLNFEQSISDELNAELLLGQDINLDKAREYALTNDIAGLTEEIANQGITAEKFSKLNRIQQEAIAKVFGMQAEELADSLYKQETINKLSGNETKNLREQAALLRQKGDLTGAINLENQAAAIEEGVLKGKTLQEAQKSIDAQEKFNLAIERAKDLFADMIDGGLIEKLISFIDKLVGSLESGRSLADTLLFGPASDAAIAKSRKSSLEEQLKSTTDESEKEKLKTKIAEQDAILKKFEEENKKEEAKPLNRALENRTGNLSQGVVGMRLMADGGIVTRPTPAIVGEAGTEAVIPLNQLMAKLDAMTNAIASNKQSVPKIYLGTTELNTATSMGTYALNEGVTS